MVELLGGVAETGLKKLAGANVQQVRTGGGGQQTVLQPSIYPADEEQLSHPQQQDSLLPRVRSSWQSV